MVEWSDLDSDAGLFPGRVEYSAAAEPCADSTLEMNNRIACADRQPDEAKQRESESLDGRSAIGSNSPRITSHTKVISGPRYLRRARG